MLSTRGKVCRVLTATALIFFSITSGAATQLGQSYRARLSPMPTTPQTVSTITGGGEVQLSLVGKTLTVLGGFSGMSSAATSAHIHNGPPAQPGPAIHQLNVSETVGGELSTTLDLSEEQISALRSNSLYIQIHSITNPAGELRGWVFPAN
jgi:hypothetical protein